MRTRVLLSIKPRFAEKIFSGVKRYEFRRLVFREASISKVVVYVSSPISKVVGEFEIENILNLEKEQLWLRTKEHSGIEKNYFDQYFQDKTHGYAIQIGATKLYEEPLHLQSCFSIKHPPQSFVYL